MPPVPAQAVFCFPSEPIIPEGPDYEKYQHYIDVRGDVLPTPHRNNDSCYDLQIILKTDTSAKRELTI